MSHIFMKIILKSIKCKTLSIIIKISIIKHSLHKLTKMFQQIFNLTNRNFRLITLKWPLLHSWKKIAQLKMNLIKNKESCLLTEILKRIENNKIVCILLNKKIWNKPHKKYLVRELNKEVFNLSSHQKCLK